MNLGFTREKNDSKKEREEKKGSSKCTKRYFKDSLTQWRGKDSKSDENEDGGVRL